MVISNDSVFKCTGYEIYLGLISLDATEGGDVRFVELEWCNPVETLSRD